MIFLGKAIEFLLGKALVPTLILAGLTMGGLLLKGKRDQIFQAGISKCEGEWELAVERQRRATAEANAAAADKQAQATEYLNTELKSDVARITQELEVYRIASADSDQRCISDRVRELARGTAGRAGSKEGGGSAAEQRSTPAKSSR